MRIKKVLFLLLVLILIYVIWLSFPLARFKTYVLEDIERDPLEIEGSYHIHTIFSDGRKHPNEIVKLAAHSSLDFIILTDHGHPNQDCLASSGWKEGVLVLAGSELSVSRGHLVALGFDPPKTPFSKNAEQAAYQVNALKGFSIIAHPFSKVSWSWGEFTEYKGIEIINANTALRYNFLRLVPISPSLLIKPEYALLKMLSRPQKNLKKWDELNLSHQVFGFFSVDAHLLYRPLLPSLRLHVLLKNPLSDDFQDASHQVFAALRQGRFFNAVDAAAQAHGFRFWAQKNEMRLYMGEETVLDSPVTLNIQSTFPFAKETHLIHNGKKILSSSENRIRFQPSSPGFYRVEVYLKEKSPMPKEIPWIVSNPIFLRD